jgi:hypothetical protein
MNYLDNNYDIFCNRTHELESNKRYNYSETISYIKDLPVYNLKNDGRVESHDNRVYFDLNNNKVVVEDGIRTRVEIGKHSDGNYGIRMWDDNGILMIDSYGIVSDSNFKSDTVTISGGFDVNYNSYYPSNTQLTVSLERQSKVIIIASTELYYGAAASSRKFSLYVGSTELKSFLNIPEAPSVEYATLSDIVTLPAGDTLIRCKNGSTDSSNGTLSNQSYSLSYVVLGS